MKTPRLGEGSSSRRFDTTADGPLTFSEKLLASRAPA